MVCLQLLQALSQRDDACRGLCGGQDAVAHLIQQGVLSMLLSMLAALPTPQNSRRPAETLPASLKLQVGLLVAFLHAVFKMHGARQVGRGDLCTPAPPVEPLCLGRVLVTMLSLRII